MNDQDLDPSIAALLGRGPLPSEAKAASDASPDPNLDPSVAKILGRPEYVPPEPSEGQKLLDAARERHKGEGIGVLQSFYRNYAMFGDLYKNDLSPGADRTLPGLTIGGREITRPVKWTGRVVGNKEYGDAVARVRSGAVTPEDAETIALYERHQEIDRKVHHDANFAERVALELGSLGKIAGEAVTGGTVLSKGGQLLGATRVGQAVGLGERAGVVTTAAGSAAPAVPAVAQQTALRQAAGYAGARVLPTLATPSLYVESAQQRNLELGRSANDIRGYPSAVGYGYANNLVLGRLQGGVKGNLLTQSAKKGALGTAELTGVDAAAEALDNYVLPKEHRTGAQSNVSKWIDATVRGDGEGQRTAARDAAVQVLSFGAFAATHGKSPDVTPQGLAKAYADAGDALVKKGYSKAAADKGLQDVHRRLEAAMAADPYLTREQAARVASDLDGPTADYAREVVKAFAPAERPSEQPAPEPKPSDAKPQEVASDAAAPVPAQVPAAPGTPTAPKADPRLDPRLDTGPKLDANGRLVLDQPAPAEAPPKPGSVRERLDALQAEFQQQNAEGLTKDQRKALRKRYAELDDLRNQVVLGKGDEPYTPPAPNPRAKKPPIGSNPPPKPGVIDPADPLASISDAGTRAFVQMNVEGLGSLAAVLKQYPTAGDRLHQIARAYAAKVYGTEARTASQSKTPERSTVASDATEQGKPSETPTPAQIAPEATPVASAPVPPVHPGEAPESGKAVAKPNAGGPSLGEGRPGGKDFGGNELTVHDVTDSEGKKIGDVSVFVSGGTVHVNWGGVSGRAGGEGRGESLVGPRDLTRLIEQFSKLYPDAVVLKYTPSDGRINAGQVKWIDLEKFRKRGELADRRAESRAAPPGVERRAPASDAAPVPAQAPPPAPEVKASVALPVPNAKPTVEKRPAPRSIKKPIGSPPEKKVAAPEPPKDLAAEAKAIAEKATDPVARDLIEAAAENNPDSRLELARSLGGYLDTGREGPRGKSAPLKSETVDQVLAALEGLGAVPVGPGPGSPDRFSNARHQSRPGLFPGDPVVVERRTLTLGEHVVYRGVVEKPGDSKAPGPVDKPASDAAPPEAPKGEGPKTAADVAAALRAAEAEETAAYAKYRKLESPKAKAEWQAAKDRAKVLRAEADRRAAGAGEKGGPETPEQERDRLKRLWESVTADQQAQIPGVRERLKELGVEVEQKRAGRYADSRERTAQDVEPDPHAVWMIENSESLGGTERVALDLYLRGGSDAHIAGKIGVSRPTAGKYVEEAFRKLKREFPDAIDAATSDEWRGAEARDHAAAIARSEESAGDREARAARGDLFASEHNPNVIPDAEERGKLDKDGFAAFGVVFPLHLGGLSRRLLGSGPGVDLTRAVKKFFTAPGLLPDSGFAAKLASDAGVRVHVQRVANSEKDLRAAVKDFFGRGYDTLSDAERKLINNALDGSEPPPAAAGPNGTKLKFAIENMRAHLDALSDELIKAGAIDGKLVEVVKEGRGSYLTRQYRVFSDPEWASQVPAEVKNRAKAWLRSEMEAAVKRARRQSTRDRRQAELDATDFDAEIEKLLTNGTAAENPIAFIAKSRLGSKDLSILKARKDVPPELRALWGEISDPLVNYVNSVAKMSHLLASHVFLTEFKRAGLAEGWLTEGRPAGGNTVPVAEPGSRAMDVLANVHASPEIKAALAEGFEKKNAGLAMRLYLKAVSFSKLAATVGSPITHARQFLSGYGMTLANGHWNPLPVLRAVKVLRDDTPAGRAYYNRLVELDVVGQGIHGSELSSTAKDVFAVQRDLAETPRGLASDATVARAVRAGLGKVAKLYHAEDAVWKVVAFEGELARYKGAYPEWTHEQAERKAAEIVRDTMPTYSMLSKFVRSLRALPVAPFASFPAEVLRNTYHTVRLAFTELADPRTRSIGASRLGGLMAAATASAALAALTRHWSDTTPENEDDMRRHLPEHEKDSRLLHFGRDDKGRRRYLDASRTDPHAYLSDALVAAFRGKSPEESARLALNELKKPFTDEEIFAKQAGEAWFNQKVDGGKVYNPAASRADKLIGAAEHVGKAFVPGAYTQGRRLYKGLAGEAEQKSGREYDPLNEAGAMVSGQRVESLRLEDSVTQKARAFNATKADAAKLLGEMLHAKGAVSPQELEAARQKAEVARKNAYDEFRADVLSAERLGMDRSKVAELLKNAEVSDEDRGLIFSGFYKPLLPPSRGTELERVRAGEARKAAAESVRPPAK